MLRPLEVIVVYLLIPTSNHNYTELTNKQAQVVYLLIPTSNHNFSGFYDSSRKVVYLLIPTSNHNPRMQPDSTSRLFISWFLHQTTTMSMVI